MNAELLSDLASYKTYRVKSVMMASRSLIQLFRTVNPELLSRKDKVRKTEEEVTDWKIYTALLKMVRYCSTTVCYYWAMSV